MEDSSLSPTGLVRHQTLADLARMLRFDNLPPLTIPNLSAMSTRSSRSCSTASDSSYASSNGDTEATEIPSPRHSGEFTSKLARSLPQPFFPQKPPLKVLLGTASLGSSLSPMAKITTPTDASAFVDAFRSRGYQDIDTARAYPVGRGGTAEKLLGHDELRLGTWANVSTKVSSFMPGSHRSRNIDSSIKKSLDSLKLECVDIMYLHAPDRRTPFEETCFAMNKAYQEGKFERFGLSNFSVTDVKEVLDICERNGLVKPSVYQGQYNPICRGSEDELLSILRQNDIAFYAYSPSACGFFSGNVTRASSAIKGSRWDIKSPLGAKYSKDYFHEFLFAAAEVVRSKAAKYGISGHAAALRWTVWHSDLQADRGDGVIIGASTQAQLEENLDIIEQGPLPQALLEAVDGVWADVRYIPKGPRFNFA